MRPRTEFDRTIDKAVAELSIAKALSPMHAEATLIAARHLIDQALDECKRTRKEHDEL